MGNFYEEASVKDMHTFLLAPKILLAAALFAALASAQASNVYTDDVVNFELPDSAVPIQRQDCAKDFVAKIPASLTSFRCKKVVHEDKVYLILKNTAPKSNRHWQFKVFDIGGDVTEIGDIQANYDVVPVLVDGTRLELLAVNAEPSLPFSRAKRSATYERYKTKGNIQQSLTLVGRADQSAKRSTGGSQTEDSSPKLAMPSPVRQSEVPPLQLQDATSQQNIINTYQYISAISSDRKPTKQIGTIRLTDVGLTLVGKDQHQNQTNTTVLFYDVYNKAQSKRKTSYTGADLGPAEVIVKASTYTNATWGTKHEVVTFSPLWWAEHKTPLIFQTITERDRFASDLRSAYNNWSIKYAGQIQQRSEQSQKAKIEKQKQLAAKSKANYENEIANIKKSVEQLFRNKKGTLKVLATAVNLNEQRTLVSLKDGINITIPEADGIQTASINGKSVYGARYNATSLIEDAVNRQRQERMKTNFSWNDLFSATSFQGDERDLQLICYFNDPSGLPSQEVTVKAKLHSFNSSKGNVSISLKCGNF